MLRYEADAWERKSELCRDSGDKAGELDAMQRSPAEWVGALPSTLCPKCTRTRLSIVNVVMVCKRAWRGMGAGDGMGACVCVWHVYLCIGCFFARAVFACVGVRVGVPLCL